MKDKTKRRLLAGASGQRSLEMNWELPNDVSNHKNDWIGLFKGKPTNRETTSKSMIFLVERFIDLICLAWNTILFVSRSYVFIQDFYNVSIQLNIHRAITKRNTKFVALQTLKKDMTDAFKDFGLHI